MGADTSAAAPAAASRTIDADALRQFLQQEIRGEVRFDRISRALYSTDASVYQIEPVGVVVPRTRDDLVRVMQACVRFGCPLTMRGGGTSQAGQAIGAGLVVDTSKYLNRVIELSAEDRWVRVEPGIVLDELNALLRPHGLRFAPDISTASRATIGGMIANNSSGARSVFYGKTIDHVLELEVLLTDGSIVNLAPLTTEEWAAAAADNGTLAPACYRTVARLAGDCAEEIARRYPKVLRRVGGYNLDEFTAAVERPNLAKLIVGSEGTLAVVLSARLNLVPLPKAKAVLTIQFADLLESLAAAPLILRHRPSAVEIMDKFILDHTRRNPALDALRKSFIVGDPASLLCVEFYGDRAEDLPPRLDALERELRQEGLGNYYCHVLEPDAQAKVWSLRESALGLSMAMKEDAKSLSFVEDTAVPPERLRDYIEQFLAIVRRHGTSAGVYAHASVGCLHVRPVVNLKTAEGVRTFESIANEVADLVLGFGGALSGEHGDGLVRSPFMEKVFGPVLYDAFRTIKRTFDPHRILNPGKIVDAPPLTANLRYGAGYQTPNPQTYFDYADYGGMSGAVEMCSGLGACRKKLDGTMCPSYMVSGEEADSTRGRANALRLAMAGRIGESGLGDRGVFDVLDLCLECRACKAECPVGVDMARFKSEFLADYWRRHGTPLEARVLGDAHRLAKWGSRLAPMSNWVINAAPVRRLNERLFGLDRRRSLPEFKRPRPRPVPMADAAEVVLFADTFTTYCEPEIAAAAFDVLAAAGVRTALAGNVCCGRPKISKGLLADAAVLSERNLAALFPHAAAGRKIVFCEPSCLSAVREDAPALLRGDAQRRARVVAGASWLFEDFVRTVADRLPLRPGPPAILFHGHCHQKSMGLAAPAKDLLARIPGTTVVDADAGCCGMAGSFGYAKKHFDVSRRIAERKLLPAVRNRAPGTVVVAAGTSCRHQVKDFAGVEALHPAVLLKSLLEPLALSPAWASLIALLIAILVSCVSPLNVGVLAIAFAWIVGLYAGLSLTDVIAGFPVSLFLTLAGVTMLFTQAQRNGTLDKLAQHALRLCRGNAGVIPMMFFALSCLLASLGPGHIAVTALIAPMAMAAAARARIPAFLMAIMVGHGATAGSLSPVAPTGVIVTGIMNRIGLPGYEWPTYLNNLMVQSAVAFAGYFVFGGWRLFRLTESEATGGPAVIQKFDVKNWITLAVIGTLLAGVLVFGINVGMAAFGAAVVLAILRAADHEEAIKRMPWAVILMVSGVTVLIALLEKTQGLDLFTSLLARFATPRTITGFIAFVTGLISVYSSTSGVVLPAFLPTVPGLVERLGGGDPIAIASSINVGAHLVDVSPLSTIGALCIAGLVPGTEDPKTLFNKMLAWGLSMTVVGAAACYLMF